MTPLQQLTQEPLHEKAYSALRDALRSGRFKPGQAMTIRTLGKELGISATPVREALQRLIAAQALQLQPNRTVIVPILTSSRFQEITKVRVRLEGLAAMEATPHLTAADRKQLEALSSAMAEDIAEQRFADYLAHNERFHFTLYEAANMPFLRQIIDLGWLQTGPWLNALVSEGRFHETANTHHEEILAAVSAHDAEGVKNAVQRDILEAAHYLARFLTDDVPLDEAV
ncbi:MAG: GntR family transcriptional regulator [Parvibaculaceae bacterium]|nr:GntR family transcriptional regulator [Parvibaculaceae bacterium]